MHYCFLFVCLIGSSVLLRSLRVPDLLPSGSGAGSGSDTGSDTTGLLTYRGSLTEPGCSETVDWVILNRPIGITPKQVVIVSYRRDLPKGAGI